MGYAKIIIPSNYMKSTSDEGPCERLVQNKIRKCEYFKKCRREDLACKEFSIYVSTGKFRILNKNDVLKNGKIKHIGIPNNIIFSRIFNNKDDE